MTLLEAKVKRGEIEVRYVDSCVITGNLLL